MTAAALAGLAFATLVSEDLATIGAAGLIRQGYLEAWPAIAACAIGVYLGDLGLWLLGRLLGRRVLQLPWICGRVNDAALSHAAERLDRHLMGAVLASRFLPGTRLPMYLSAGVLGRRPLAFAAWSLVAVLLWTPLLAGAAMLMGTTVATLVIDRASTTIVQVLGASALVAAVRYGLRSSGRSTRPAAP